MEMTNVRYAEEITPSHIAKMMTLLEEKELRPRTLNNYREITHRFLQHLLDEKGIVFRETGRENPAGRIRRLHYCASPRHDASTRCPCSAC